MSIKLKKIIASIAAFAIVATAVGLGPVFRSMSASAAVGDKIPVTDAEGNVVTTDDGATVYVTDDEGNEVLETAPPVQTDPSDQTDPTDPTDPVDPTPVKVTGDAAATAGTYTVTLEIEVEESSGIAEKPASVGIVVGDKTVTFTKGEDGKYTADIDIAEEELDAFKEGLALSFVGADNDAYTIGSATATKKGSSGTDPVVSGGVTDPVETDPVETDPAETDPAETDPAETDPVETAPAETTAAATTAAAAPASSNNPVNSSAGAVEQVVSSPAQVTNTKKPDITVNAAETDVTPAMVKAFTNNKNTKTLTLKYDSTLKVAIDKDSIKDASANLDFSVSGKKFLPAKEIKKLNAEKVVQLDFENKGKLEGVDKVTIKARVGVNYMGKTVTVYAYQGGKLVKIGTASVNGAGIVKINTNYLGQFVLAVE